MTSGAGGDWYTQFWQNFCCQLANPAWYPQPTIAATNIQKSVGLATSCNESSTNRVSSCTRTRLVRRRAGLHHLPAPASHQHSITLFTARLQQRRLLPTKKRAANWWPCYSPVAAPRAWNRLSTTETRAVVNSNIQAPSEVLSFSHHGIAYRQLNLVRSSIATFRRHLKSHLSHTMESPTDNWNSCGRQ